MTTERQDEIAGALLGLAWGDVLGCPVEFWSAALIERVFGRYDALPRSYPFAAIPKDPRIWGHLRPLGLHSDDTQQALALLQVCLHPDGFRVSRWVEYLLSGARASAWRGTGRNFRSALGKLARGVAPSQSGGPSAGIGAAMKIAPLGAIYRADPQTLARVVFEATCTTHNDARAISYAFAVAACCASLSMGDGVAEVRAQLPERVSQFEADWIGASNLPHGDDSQRHAVSRELRALFAQTASSLDELRSWLRSRAGQHPVDRRELSQLPNHPFVMLGGMHALAVGLCPEGEPAALLADVVRRGGDADTVGAITGAILGARHGTRWIPSEHMLDAQALRAYSRALPLPTLPESFDELLRREAHWTQFERDFQAELAAQHD